MKLAATLNNATLELAQAGIDSAQLDAEVLLAHSLQCTRANLLLKNSTLSTEQNKSYQSLIQRRKNFEPVAYITGTKDFWSLKLKVSSDVLIPRPETEHLVERAIEIVQADEIKPQKDLHILDLCTGSGCIAAALAHELPNCQITATDYSAKAITIAKHNLKFAQARINFLQGDLFAALPPISDQTFPQYDLITCNPPYGSCDDKNFARESKAYEPHLALMAEDNGFKIIDHILNQAHKYLQPKGWLILEVGYNQAEQTIKNALATNKYSEHSIKKDLAGIERIISLKKS